MGIIGDEFLAYCERDWSLPSRLGWSRVSHERERQVSRLGGLGGHLAGVIWILMGTYKSK
jgi:hypothetical protein